MTRFDGRSPIGGYLARGREAVHAGHTDVENGQVGLVIAHERDGFVAAAGLADDVVALLLEDLLEVETDDRLVLGNDNAHVGRPSGGHQGSGRIGQVGEAVEQNQIRPVSHRQRAGHDAEADRPRGILGGGGEEGRAPLTMRSNVAF